MYCLMRYSNPLFRVVAIATSRNPDFFSSRVPSVVSHGPFEIVVFFVHFLCY